MTGSGKSSLGNFLLGDKRFVVSEGLASCTVKTTLTERGRWESDGREFDIMDTPGNDLREVIIIDLYHRIWRYGRKRHRAHL